jgi:Domain of unknown function (DUF4294)
MWVCKSYNINIICFLLFCWLLNTPWVSAQAPVPDSTSLPPDIQRPVLGPNDTIPVPAKILDGTLVPAQTLGYIFVSAPAPPGMKERIEKWTRLRNAVYVTYPYARKAGNIMNDINARIAIMPDKQKRKEYIKSREKDLKKEFADPLQQLSVYQGKVLMKLINRQAHNNCYEIIKEYKGGITARFWQTVAFFFNSSLKQPYDATGEDKEIESIVMEVERMYGSR